MNQNTTYDPNVVNTLYNAFGAQLLRVRADKAPAESRGWVDRQPSLDDLLAHVESDGLLGLTPASLDAVVVDVDVGDPAGLLSAFPPRALYQTPRGGVHAYYQHDGAPVRQHRWVAPVFRTSGDLRHGSGGYVVLWQPERLIDDLRRARRSVKFAEVRQALVVSPPAPQGRQATPKSPPDGTEPTPDDLAPSPARSRHAWVKARLIAARVDGRTGPELRQYARQLHAGLVQPPDPRVPHFFPLAEALAVAQWVAGRDWSSEQQRLRGLRSGQHRRSRTADRDQRIVAMLRAGRSQRETARALGVTRRIVQAAGARAGLGKV